jgi:plasmid stability protein
MTVDLPDDLAARLAAVAATRGVSPEALVVEAVEALLPPPPSFIGIGASGTTESIGRRHREIIQDALADKTARDL